MGKSPSHRPRLLDQVRERIRLKHYSIRTEKTYLAWVRRFILFHDKRHPRDLGKSEVEAFLTYLAVERHVAASTQNQALNAILFLYKEVLGIELAWMDDVVRVKRPARIPEVLSAAEVARLLAQLDGTYRLMASLLYGSGLRLMEAVRLRVK
jgi:integrase